MRLPEEWPMFECDSDVQALLSADACSFVGYSDARLDAIIEPVSGPDWAQADAEAEEVHTRLK